MTTTAEEGRGDEHQLVCAICLYDGKHEDAEPAATVIGGYAVCYDHLGYVAQGSEWSSIISAAKRED